MGEPDFTAREEFIGLCLAAIIVLFVFIVSYS